MSPQGRDDISWLSLNPEIPEIGRSLVLCKNYSNTIHLPILLFRYILLRLSQGPMHLSHQSEVLRGLVHCLRTGGGTHTWGSSATRESKPVGGRGRYVLCPCGKSHEEQIVAEFFLLLVSCCVVCEYMYKENINFKCFCERSLLNSACLAWPRVVFRPFRPAL